MKKENKLFLSVFIGFLIIISVIIFINQKIIKKGNDLKDLRGELFSLIEDDGGWAGWENDNSEDKLEDITYEKIENISLESNINETNLNESNVSGYNGIKKYFIEPQENIKKREYKQDYKDNFLGNKIKISAGQTDYEFTVGFYISIFLIILVLGIISFWAYSFLKKNTNILKLNIIVFAI